MPKKSVWLHVLSNQQVDTENRWGYIYIVFAEYKVRLDEQTVLQTVFAEYKVRLDENHQMKKEFYAQYNGLQYAGSPRSFE